MSVDLQMGIAIIGIILFGWIISQVSLGKRFFTIIKIFIDEIR